MVIDINLDDGLLDGMAAMQKFCKIAVTEPDVSKVQLHGSHGSAPLYILSLAHRFWKDFVIDVSSSR